MVEKVLVTGATGYVASRLVPALLECGHRVRATSRHPEALLGRHPQIEVVPSDMLDAASLREALEGIDVAYYLVHSMAGKDFAAKDRKAASAFAAATEGAGVRRIVYLGGLGAAGDKLSSHLASRHEVGEILAGSSVQTIELRAAIVIGAGSVAFEMLRYLTERLPLMIAPRWLNTRIQPVPESDLVDYLVAAATVGVEEDQVVEIGGTDILTYRNMILAYAAERKLRRGIVGVPVLTPTLSSYWIKLVTPIPTSMARPLIDGLKNEVVVTDESATKVFPEIAPGDYRSAVRRLLGRQVELLETTRPARASEIPGTFDSIFVDRQWVLSAADPKSMSEVIASIGGDPRWYPLRWTWWVRARLDDLFGGTGLRWERPEGNLEPGARVDWWTVKDITEDRLLLRAEIKAPGEAWLEWRVVPHEDGSELRQTAYFRPRGALGHLYWWGLYPFHAPIFRLMAAGLAGRAEDRRRSRGKDSPMEDALRALGEG
ncbi:MAG: SDR family oxidoreductase [Actinomycetota bacterium]|nr:SDR family oxidoreductase [Actinomycetota bacterium]